MEIIKAIEAVSEADGSTGWTLMIGVETVGIATGAMPNDTAEKILGDNPAVTFSGAINALGRARRVAGGLVVSGRWPYASGCAGADWFWGGCTVFDDDGEPTRIGRHHRPLLTQVIVPARRLHRARHVALARAVRHRLARRRARRGVRPQRADDGHLRRGMRVDTPLFRMPPYSRLAFNKVGVATGVARAALDAFVALATEKTPLTSTALLRERPQAQLAIAEAEARLPLGARRSSSSRWPTSGTLAAEGNEATLRRAGDGPPGLLALLRRGGAGRRPGDRPGGHHRQLPLDRPLERCASATSRVVPQHVTVAPSAIQDAGRGPARPGAAVHRLLAGRGGARAATSVSRRGRWGTMCSMPRPVWSGTISFGLVAIPIKLFHAVSKKSVSFNQLDERTMSRIRMKKVSAETGEDVGDEHIIKGYEISKGRYVQVDPDELEPFIPSATKSIDLEEFVDLDEIDPVYFDSPYIVAPDKTPKPYVLLAQAMEEAGKVAIGRFVMRNKQYVAAVRAQDGKLLMSTMVVRRRGGRHLAIEELEVLDTVDVSAKEVTMAEALVESLTAPFDPSKYRDEYREQVLVADRAQGRRGGVRVARRRARGAEGGRPDGGARGQRAGRQGRPQAPSGGWPGVGHGRTGEEGAPAQERLIRGRQDVDGRARRRARRSR